MWTYPASHSSVACSQYVRNLCIALFEAGVLQLLRTMHAGDMSSSRHRTRDQSTAEGRVGRDVHPRNDDRRCERLDAAIRPPGPRTTCYHDHGWGGRARDGPRCSRWTCGRAPRSRDTRIVRAQGSRGAAMYARPCCAPAHVRGEQTLRGCWHARPQEWCEGCKL